MEGDKGMKKRTRAAAICAVLAAVLVAGTAVENNWISRRTAVEEDVPQLVTFTDSADGSVIIDEEEVPLAAKPVVKTQTTTKKSTTRTKMKTKAAKTSQKTETKTSVQNTTKNSKTQKIQVQTTTKTTIQTSLKKASNIKTTVTTIQTTVRTTTTPITVKETATSNKTTASKTAAKYVSVRSIAPKAHANVLKAFENLDYKVYVNPSVSYSGKMDAKAQLITVHTNSDEAIYHELGHFVAFLAGNADTKPEFKNIYNSEKNKFKGTRNNDAYIKGSASEYFAESYQDYVERPGVLKSARPKTYEYIVSCVGKINDSRVVMIKNLYYR